MTDEPEERFLAIGSPVAGGKALLLVDDPGTRQILGEVWDEDCYGFRRAVDLAGATVVDVGANVGVTTLVALLMGAERVVAVEPDSVNADQLEENLALNGLTDRVDVVRAAVAAGDGARVMRRPPGPAGANGSSWADPVLEPGAATVRAVPLDEVCPPGGLVLKVDCEGAEYEALAGATDGLLARCTFVAVEYHAFPARNVRASRRLPGLLGRLAETHDLELHGGPGTGLVYAWLR